MQGWRLCHQTTCMDWRENKLPGVVGYASSIKQIDEGEGDAENWLEQLE